MGGYWFRHRSVATLVVAAVVGLVSGLLFIFPYISQEANLYNTQSIYNNSEMDFVAPEPSFEQVAGIKDTNSIDKVFPYFLTKTQVNANGKSRTTTVLLSDQFENIDITMYNQARLIEKSNSNYDNGILVDWQFCKDTGAGLDDTVSFAIDGNQVEFKISAIYETNGLYDGGAVLAKISSEQRDSIMEKSKNSGYSGMYVKSNDYTACKTYLTTDYRPLGRLKSREQFDSDEQYQVHYDAIMASGYANEITDFRVRESNKSGNNILMLVLAAALSFVALLIFNIVMSKRGCEKTYFMKNCIPKGQNVKPYYNVSFIMELVLTLALMVGAVIFRVNSYSEYIPKNAFDIIILIVPGTVVVTEVICLMMNHSGVAALAKKNKGKK